METKTSFRLSPFLANIVSLMAVGMVTAILLLATIGLRDSRLGLLILGGMAAVGLAGAIFFRPQVGTYILAISVFTNISALLTDRGLPGINKPLVALTFIVVMVAYFSRQRGYTIRFRWVEWLLVAYGAALLASYFVATDPYITADEIVEFGKSFIILLCFVYSLKSIESWKQTIWLLMLSGTFLAVLNLYQVLSGNFAQTFWGLASVTPDVSTMRLSGPVGDPNFYGQMMAALLPLALYRVLDEKKIFLRVVAGASVLLLAFVILNTYSRGAFLAMVVTLILIALERRIKLSLVVVIALASLVLVQFLPEGYTKRIETLFIFVDDGTTVHGEESFRGRSSEMMSSLMMFNDHPFLGVGAGNYENNYQDYASELGLEYRTEDRQAHSLYLEIAAETGALGLITFGGLIIALFAGLIRARRKSANLKKHADWPTWIVALQMSLISYLITSIFLHGDYSRYLFLLIALAAAAIHLSHHLSKTTAQPSYIATAGTAQS